MNFYLQQKLDMDTISEDSIDLITNTLVLRNKTKYGPDTMAYEPDANKITGKSDVPVGNLDYCGTYLRNIHGVENMEPIEVPDVLRREEFLHREYNILPKDEVPSTGRWFIKMASKLKTFSNALSSGLLTCIDLKLEDGLYVVSEWVQFMSEFRVFVERDEIKGIQFYNGDPSELPDKDKIRRMVTMYMMDKDRPLAYTMDIGVILHVDGYKTRLETVIIEVHPMVSCGLYGFIYSSLPYMYRLGIDYYKEVNKPISVYRWGK